MKTVMYTTGTLVFLVSLFTGPLKSEIDKWLSMPIPAETEQPVKAQAKEYARTPPPDVKITKADDNKSTVPTGTTKPTTIAHTDNSAVSAPKPEPKLDPPSKRPAQSPEPPTLQEIKDAIRQASVEAIVPLLQPIVTQVNKLTEKATALEEAVARLEAANVTTQSDSARTAAALRAELDVVRTNLKDLTAIVEVLKTNANKERVPQRDKDPEFEKLKVTVDKLADAVGLLSRKVDAIPKPAEPKKPELKQPDPVSGSWNSKKNVKLSCGYIWESLDVKPEGVYVRCPKCNQLSFVK